MDFSNKPMWKHQKESEVATLEKEKNQHQIVVHNDDFNTFDFVIASLVEVCEHSPTQAEQCTLFIHYKGKCDVLTGELSDLKAPWKKLTERGLTAEIV